MIAVHRPPIMASTPATASTSAAANEDEPGSMKTSSIIPSSTESKQSTNHQSQSQSQPQSQPQPQPQQRPAPLAPIGSFPSFTFAELESAYQHRLASVGQKPAKPNKRKPNNNTPAPAATAPARKKSKPTSRESAAVKPSTPQKSNSSKSTVPDIPAHKKYGADLDSKHHLYRAIIQSLPELPPLPEEITPALTPAPFSIYNARNKTNWIQWYSWMKCAWETLRVDRVNRLGPRSERILHYQPGAGLRAKSSRFNSSGGGGGGSGSNNNKSQSNSSNRSHKKKVPINSTMLSAVASAPSASLIQQQQQHHQQQNPTAAEFLQRQPYQHPGFLQQQQLQQRPIIPIKKDPIEDSDIPGSLKIPLPKFNNTFPGLNQSDIPFILRIYDFINLFKKQLEFEGIGPNSINPLNGIIKNNSEFQFSLSGLITIITNNGINNNNPPLNNLFRCLTSAAYKATEYNDTLIKETLQKRRLIKKSLSEQAVNHSRVINQLTWQENLRLWLIQQESLGNINGVKLIYTFLSIDTAAQLTIQQRIQLLKVLIDYIITSEWIRELTERGMEEIVKSRKQIRTDRLNQLQGLKIAEKQMGDIAKTMSDLVVKVVEIDTAEAAALADIVHQNELNSIGGGAAKRAALKRARDAADIERFRLQSILPGEYTKLGLKTLHEFDNLGRIELDNKENQLINDYPLRSELLGTDRHYNRYYTLANSNQYLFIESINSTPIAKINNNQSQSQSQSQAPQPNNWSYINNATQFAELIKYLNPGGKREFELKKRLESLVFNWSNELIEESIIKYNSNPALNSTDFTILFDSTKHYLRATEYLVSELSLDNGDYHRCLICQEQINSSSELHCSYCHHTFPAAEISTENYSLHTALCESQNNQNNKQEEDSDSELINNNIADEDTIAVDLSIGRRVTRSLLPGQGQKQKRSSTGFSSDDDDSSDEELLAEDEPETEITAKTEQQQLQLQQQQSKQPSNNTTADYDEKKMDTTVDNVIKTELTATVDAITDNSATATATASASAVSTAASTVKSESNGVIKSEPIKIDADADADAAPSTAPAPAAATVPPAVSTPDKKLTLVKRITPRPTCLNDVSPQFRVLKALLLDIEAAIPVESVRNSNEKLRKRWIENVKLSHSVKRLSKRLSELQLNLNSNWLRWWFKSEQWLLDSKSARTEPQLALLLFTFDRALIYSESELLEEQKNKKSVFEAAAASEDPAAASVLNNSLLEDDNWTGDGCRICHSIENPSKLLICDGPCGAEFHTYCLNPALKSVPKGKFYCARCSLKDVIAGSTVVKKRAYNKKGDKPNSAKSAAAIAAAKKNGKWGRNFDPDDDEYVEMLLAAQGDQEDGSGSIEFETPQQRQQQQAEDYGICKTCKLNEGDPLLCDGCDAAYHIGCLNPPLEKIPEGDWFCSNCTEQLQILQKQNKSKGKSVDKGRNTKGRFAPKTKQKKSSTAVAASTKSNPDASTVSSDANSGKIRIKKPARGWVYIDESSAAASNSQPAANQLNTLTSHQRQAAARKRSNLADEASDVDMEDESEDQSDADADAESDDGEAEYAPDADADADADVTADIDPDSEPGRLIDDSDDLCCVCYNGDSTDDNPIMYCDGDNCQTIAHKDCLGVQNIPAGDWLCARCSAGIKPNSINNPCVLCNNTIGAMQIISNSGPEYDGLYCHLSCAIWTEGVFFDDVELRQPICGINSISNNRWKQYCEICRKRSGVPISCDSNNCSSKFHVTCALNESSNYSLNFQLQNGIPTRTCLCKQHSK